MLNLSSSYKLFLHLKNSLLNFSACVNTGLVIYFSMANKYQVPTVCWPWGKIPKVVTVNDVPDLREFTAGNGVALEMEGLVDQEISPNYCVPEYKCSLSLVLLSSFYNKETVT